EIRIYTGVFARANPSFQTALVTATWPVCFQTFTLTALCAGASRRAGDPGLALLVTRRSTDTGRISMFDINRFAITAARRFYGAARHVDQEAARATHETGMARRTRMAVAAVDDLRCRGIWIAGYSKKQKGKNEGSHGSPRFMRGRC